MTKHLEAWKHTTKTYVVVPSTDVMTYGATASGASVALSSGSDKHNSGEECQTTTASTILSGKYVAYPGGLLAVSYSLKLSVGTRLHYVR